MLCGSGAKCGEIRFDQCRVVGSLGALPTVEVQRDFHVSTNQLLLQLTAKLHLERFGSAGHSHVQVEKTMIHALETERKAKRFRDAARNAGETCHRIKRQGNGDRSGHASTFPSRTGSRDSISATSMNCNR